MTWPLRKKKTPQEPSEPTAVMKSNALLAAAESLTIAHMAREEDTTEARQIELNDDWNRVLKGLANETEVQLFMWATVSVAAASIESLLEYVQATQTTTVGVVAQYLDLSDEAKSKILHDIPPMSKFMTFETFVQHTTMQAMEMSEQ